MQNEPAAAPALGELAAWLNPLVSSLDATVKERLQEEPFQRDPRVLESTLPLLQAVNRYFGAEGRGWDSHPHARPVLIVGNHSGGAQTIDAAPLLEWWIRDRGSESPLYLLGYDLLFAFPVIGPWLRQLGLLRANPALAKTALQRGASA